MTEHRQDVREHFDLLAKLRGAVALIGASPFAERCRELEAAQTLLSQAISETEAAAPRA